MSSESASSVEVEARIDAIRRWEPKIEALVNWDEQAARRRAEQAADGPLAGWSIAAKDIIDVAGMPTGCNADFLDPPPALKNAAVLDALIEQGAFLISKAVTTTFAFFDPGPTRNPWRIEHTPGGSSSGSAAAVAAGMARLAFGSQTVASVNRPASFCGVVGVKPTYGRLPIAGFFPFSPSVDTAGFFTANAADARSAFAALAGEPVRTASDRLRIGVLIDQGCEPPEPAMQEAIRRSADLLSSAGFEVRDCQPPSAFAEAFDHHWDLVAIEADDVHRELMDKFSDVYPPKLRELIERGRGLGENRLTEIANQRRGCGEKLEAMLGDLDLLLTASAPGPAPEGIHATGDPRMSLLWTYMGVPSVTLPACLDESGLPLGIQLVGRKTSDGDLLAAAEKVEAVLNFTAKPALP